MGGPKKEAPRPSKTKIREFYKASGMSKAEIGAVCGVTESAIKKWLEPDGSYPNSKQVELLSAMAEAGRKLKKEHGKDWKRFVRLVPLGWTGGFAKLVPSQLRRPSENPAEAINMAAGATDHLLKQIENLPDSLLVDLLQRRGWVVTLTKPRE